MSELSNRNNPKGFKHFQKAQTLIPWGTQTNGKRPHPALLDVSPLFVASATGCRFKDTDGRWFIDYRAALGPIILGYNNPNVQEAVIQQLSKGIVFSLATELEYEVASLIAKTQPGMEKMRFLKSGHEANLAALRLARAFTGKDKIICCGYHGHSDWFAAGIPAESGFGWKREGNGVPLPLDAFVFHINYGDIEKAEELFEHYGESIAGVMTVPYDWNDQPQKAFLESLRHLTTKNNSILIFDQVLTGFRLHLQGAQTFFDVIPDLSTYAKALANGFPLAVFGGKKEVMDELKNVIITTTHAGEALSLAAAKATISTLIEQNTIEIVWKQGQKLMEGFNKISSNLGMEAVCKGLPPAPHFQFSSDKTIQHQLQLIFHRALLEKGIFPNQNFLIMGTHSDEVVEETLEAFKFGLEKVVETNVKVEV